MRFDGLPDWSGGTGAVPPHGAVAPRVRWVAESTEVCSADAAVVLVHGRGGSAAGILELADHVRVPEGRSVVWVAPEAATNSWYPESFLAPVERNEPGRSSGLDVLSRIVRGIEEAGVPGRRILVGGFSQGGCLALEFAARLRAPLGGVFALSGGLIGPPRALPHYEGDMGGMYAFLGCSDRDPHIPVERVRASASIVGDLGADVDLRIYPGMGHTVNRDELEAVGEIIERASRAAPTSSGNPSDS